jgi:hypothetical protein
MFGSAAGGDDFLKVTVSRDFRPSVFFSLNDTPGPPDSWADVVFRIGGVIRFFWSDNANLKILFYFYHLLPHSAEANFLLDNANLNILFYCHGTGKINFYRFFDRLLL